MKLVAGIEVEYAIESEKHLAERWRRSSGARELTIAEQPPTINHQDVRRRAELLLAKLQPNNPRQEERLAQWKAELPHFAIRDLANFAIYERLARPTLDIGPRPMVGQSYAMTINNFDLRRPLAYRFGLGRYQTGYYDNPDVSEKRTHPLPFEYIIKTRNQLYRTLGSVASALDCRAFILSNHLSVSAFHDDGTPYFQKPEADITPYARIGTSLSQLFAHGMLAEPDGNVSQKTLRIGPHRTNHVRLMPGRIELRIDEIRARHLKWLRTGFTQAFGENSPDLPEAPISPAMLVLERQENFDKTSVRDLYLYRVLEHASLHKDGYIDFDHFDPQQDYERPALYGLIGRDSRASYPHCVQLLRSFFRWAVVVGADGQLHCDPKRLKTLLQHLTIDEAGGNYSDGKSGMLLSDVAQINEQLSKIRVHGNAATIQYETHLTHRQLSRGRNRL